MQAYVLSTTPTPHAVRKQGRLEAEFVLARRCNRENRHRAVCNTRAEVPGLAAYAEEELAAEGVCGADFLGHWPLQGIKEEQPGCEDLNDGEQGRKLCPIPYWHEAVTERAQLSPMQQTCLG